MDYPTHTTHLSLLRKYDGKIMNATSEERVEAARHIPAGKNALTHLFEALRLYTAEMVHLTQ